MMCWGCVGVVDVFYGDNGKYGNYYIIYWGYIGVGLAWRFSGSYTFDQRSDEHGI